MKGFGRKNNLDLNALAERQVLQALIVSDTHGSLRLLHSVLRRFSDVELILHLGDHAAPYQELKTVTDLPVIAVAGNCDGRDGKDLPETLRLTLAGVRLFLTHGHRFRVKHDLAELIAAATTPPVESDLILFGHTHRYLDSMLTTEGGKSFRLLNPGSACLSPFNPHPSCALLRIDTDRVEIIRFTPDDPA